MLETLRPRFSEGVTKHRRQDWSWGIRDGRRGLSAELAPDQDTWVPLIDGQRSLSELAEAHLAEYGSVPFSALRDLLRTLASRGLLANDEAELRASGLFERPSWVQRWASVRLATVSIALTPLPPPRAQLPRRSKTGPGALILILLFYSTIFGLGFSPLPLSPFALLWAYAGISLALTTRSFAKAALLLRKDAIPQSLQLCATFGVVHFAADTSGEVMLDRTDRAVVHAAGWLGGLAVALAGRVVPPLLFGVLVAAFFDLCPFAPTSFGRLLATLAGKVDLREHARAYLSRRLIRRAVSPHFFEGEGSLVVSAMLSIAWVCLGVRLTLTHGAAAAMELIALGLGEQGFPRAMALAGAAVLALAVPASLGVMALAVARAVRAFLPARADEGEHTGRPAEVDLDAVPLFLRLSPEDRIALTRAAQVRRFPPGSRIVVQGEAGDRFYAIRSGEVVVERELDSGVRKEVARLGPGDCFGETALLERTPRTATVRALGEVSALVLSQQDFARVQGDLAGAEVTQFLRASAGLHQSALFSHLAKDRLSALAMQLKACAVAAGEVVVQEGDEGDTFYLVESGALEVSVDGKTIATLGPGQHFGEVALLRDVARTATIRALEPSLVLTLDKKRFIAAVASDLSVSARLEEVAAKRVEATR